MSLDLSKIELSTPTYDLGRMNVLIYGLPKVGKTTLASQFPDALFLATERGHNFVSIKKIDVVKWEQIYELATALKAQKHDFKTLVVDIADLFYKLCERYVTEKHGITHPSDLEFGKGFSFVRDEFTKIVNGLNMMGFGMVFISHAKEKEIKKRNEKWTYMSTTMGGTAESVICGMCDLILYCYIDQNQERVMRTKPTQYVNAGDRSRKLPEIMPMSYKEILNAFKK